MEYATWERDFRKLVNKHREGTLITCVVLGACLIQTLVPHKLIAINFFFLPTVFAAYCLGTRTGGLTALLSFLIMGIYAAVSTQRFLFEITPELLALDLVLWGAFLGLTGLAVGSLSDQRKAQLRELRQAYVGTLEILAKYLESSDHYTKSHSVRVAELSVKIAQQLDLGDDDVDHVRAGALLHDIGKTESIELVKRASQLDEHERQSLASHTIAGSNLVRSMGTILQDTIPVILYHHHYYGGRDGQEGPRGDEIPLAARIVAVADAYDAMVTDRPYRKGRAPWQAVAEIESCAGTQFDPKVVAAFKRVMPGDLLEPETEEAAISDEDAFDESPRTPAMPPILDALASGDRLGM